MRYYTAGESHGQGLVAVVEDVPAGLRVSEAQINVRPRPPPSGLRPRRADMTIERDTVQVIVRRPLRAAPSEAAGGNARGRNRDWANWTDRMAPFGEPSLEGLVREVTPRPGHAGPGGRPEDEHRRLPQHPRALKRPHRPPPRVAAAGIAREFLADLGVEVFSYVNRHRRSTESCARTSPFVNASRYTPLDIETSEVRLPPNAQASARHGARDRARRQGRARHAWAARSASIVRRALFPGVGGYATCPPSA